MANSQCIKLVTGFRVLRFGIGHCSLLRLHPLIRNSLLPRLRLRSSGLNLRLHHVHLLLGLLWRPKPASLNRLPQTSPQHTAANPPQTI